MARRSTSTSTARVPWTYLAFHAVQPLAAELGAEIAWKPILVGGVFNAVNQTSTTTAPSPIR
jgi:2-hydroxychromene-2-carboxylate isomerase